MWGKQSDYMRFRGEVASHVTDSLQGIDEIVGYGVVDRRLGSLDVLQGRVFEAAKYSGRVFGFRRAVNNFLWVGQLSVLGVLGVYLRVDVLFLVLFLVALVRVNEVLRGVEAFSTDLIASLACAVRLYDVCHRLPLVDNRGVLLVEDSSFDVVFEGVCFSYPSSDCRVLSDVDLVFPRGSWTCIVGATGSGKSSLLALLLKFFYPSSGRVLLNGQDIVGVDVDSLRSSVCLVSQRGFLFNDSIAQNLRLVCPEASDEDLWQALRFACLDDEVALFDDGLDTVVGDRGKCLSGGQVQRLCLARVFLSKPKVLVLDEFTAHLNVELDSRIRENLRLVFPDVTVIEVTHRLDSVLNSDGVVVFDSGRVVEQGSASVLFSDPNSVLSSFLSD